MSFEFKDKSYYRGTVKNQELVLTGKEDEEIPALILTIGLEGQLVDTFDPTKGHTPCPLIDVAVMMRFDQNNEDTVEIQVGDLEKLGFTGDLDKLNPDEVGHHSFVGQVVHVTPTTRTRNDREVKYWNLRFPVKRENKKVAKGALAKSGASKAFRDAHNRRKAGVTGDTPF